jgi:hypothetical protein
LAAVESLRAGKRLVADATEVPELTAHERDPTRVYATGSIEVHWEASAILPCPVSSSPAARSSSSHRNHTLEQAGEALQAFAATHTRGKLSLTIA